MRKQDHLNRTEAGLARSERGKSSSRSIPNQVGRLFYAVGFFGASYPIIVISFSIIVILTACYPLLTLPLPGNRPKEFVTAFENFSSPPLVTGENVSNWPRWYRGPPALYVQQIIVKSSVYPWNSDLIITDAFRGTLSESFQLMELVKNFSPNNEGSSGLSDICFKVLDVKSKVLKGKNTMLPENQCLIVSPTNFWQDSYPTFQDDSDILDTMLNYQSHQKGRSGLAEILLGVSVKDTGLKRFPHRAKQRIVSFAVTIVLQKYDPKFINLLEASLKKHFDAKKATLSKDNLWPSENSTFKRHDSKERKIVHIFYPSHSSLIQLIPLVFTYIAMFIYVYFSVKKIEMVKSKLGLAFSALTAVVASLCMSVGLCTHFGLMYEINAKDIFPYVVVIIGLENVLVLTRSVVSTGSHLDSKIRVAQGLSKEGWSTIKNLSAEVTILTIGFFTFIPQIQEFCMLAILGLLSDFFIQTFFFATVLSVDMRRNEFAGGANNPASSLASFRKPIHPRLDRVKSNPGLANGSIPNQHKNTGPSQVVAPSKLSPIFVKIPRRLRVISFWAKTRFFQRTFIIFMVGWISFIIYESGIIAHFNIIETEHLVDDVVVPNVQMSDSVPIPKQQRRISSPGHRSTESSNILITDSFIQSINNPGKVEELKGKHEIGKESQNYNAKLLNELYDCNSNSWRRLSLNHWQVLLGIYNVSLSGKYISILPQICIGIPVPPSQAILRRSKYEQENAANWQTIAKEPGDLKEYEYVASQRGKYGQDGHVYSVYSWDDPYIPTTPVELTLVLLLAIPSAIFLSYSLIVFYRCVCTRNYAEWRSSWTKVSDAQDYYTQVVFEAVPLILSGHKEEVECMGSDGNIISTVCLDGNLKIWNINTGDNITTVDRRLYFEELSKRNEEASNFFVGSDADSPVGSSPPGNNFMNSTIPENADVRHRQHANSWSLDSPQTLSYSENFVPNSPIDHQAYNTFGSQNILPLNANANQYAGIGDHRYNRANSTKHRRLSSYPNQTYQVQEENLYHGDFSPPIPVPEDNQHIVEQTRGIGSGNLNNSVFARGSEALLDEPSSLMAAKRSVQRSNSRLESPTEKSTVSNLDEAPPVWCLDCVENMIVLGTGSGRVEFWDATLGRLKCAYDDDNGIGVVFVRLIGSKVVAAKINGCLDFLQLETHTRNNGSPSLYHRGQHLNEIESTYPLYCYESEIRCVWLSSQKAHQQPITCLECDTTNIITGSQDHVLKVFRLQDQHPLFSLHGHYGPITSIFIDKVSPLTSGSGSQDGLLCVWDLQTGMCVYSIQAHDGPINALTYSVSYIISAGGDDKICVWERFQGHLLNTIQLDHAYCSSLVMLTHNLLITSKQGSLVVWDVRSGDAVREVRLGHRDKTVFVRQIMICADAILCDYGSQLRLVRFPSVISKVD